MTYNWEGDRILQDTAIQDKRFVIGERCSITTDIREWISFEDNIIMKEILKYLKEDHKPPLPSSKGPGDFDKRAMVVWQFVAGKLEYIHDITRYKKEDFWLFPPETLRIGKGDCEDGSFLLASLLIASGISPFCVRVVLGEVFDEDDRPLGGHCWPVYKNEIGKWCILESTLDTIPSRMPEADMLTGEAQSFRYRPLYCFNDHHLWEIFPSDINQATDKDIKRYFKARKKRVNMRETRLPSVGWLSRLTGDWEPGHFEITTEVMSALGFHHNAVDVSADASQDPDFYDWYAAPAHAQTDNDEKGRTSQSRDDATDKFIGRIKEFTVKSATAAVENAREGLFNIGYLLHSIQDLATHRGITNSQHSYLSKIVGTGKDPDHVPANRDKAREFSRFFLGAFGRRYPESYDAMVAYRGRVLPWDRLLPGEKSAVLGRGWDLSPGAFIEYKNLADKYERIKAQYPVGKTLWDADMVFEQVMDTLKV